MTWLWRVEQGYYDNDDVGGVLFFWLCYMHVFSFVGLQYGDWYSVCWWVGVEFYLYPTVGTVLIHSVKPELTE